MIAQERDSNINIETLQLSESYQAIKSESKWRKEQEAILMGPSLHIEPELERNYHCHRPIG